MADFFYVRDRGGAYYPANVLTYGNGAPVVDTVVAAGISPYRDNQLLLYPSTPGFMVDNTKSAYLVVPEGYDVGALYGRGQEFGTLLTSANSLRSSGEYGADLRAANLEALAGQILVDAFAPKVGTYDTQYQSLPYAIRDAAILGYDRLTGANFDAAEGLIPSFTNIGNYGIGVFYAGANSTNSNFDLDAALQKFGSANADIGGRDTSQEYGGSLHGNTMIKQGYQDAISGSLNPANFPVSQSEYDAYMATQNRFGMYGSTDVSAAQSMPANSNPFFNTNVPTTWDRTSDVPGTSLSYSPFNMSPFIGTTYTCLCR